MQALNITIFVITVVSLERGVVKVLFFMKFECICISTFLHWGFA